MEKNLFDMASVADVRNGFIYDMHTEHYVCIHCGAHFERGVIYRLEDELCDARRSAARHIQTAHGGSVTALLAMDKRQSGLTDAQKDVFRLLFDGLADAQIAERLGISASTVRNLRFQAREKALQAKVLLAVTALAEAAREKEGEEYPVQTSGKTNPVDDLFCFTEHEKDEIIRNFFDEQGRIHKLPAREKGKVIVLHVLAPLFVKGRDYTEKQVNEILQEKCPRDYVTVRRYLVAYRFLARVKDGSRYWVVDSSDN